MVVLLHAIDDARPACAVQVYTCTRVRLMQSACARIKASGGRGAGEEGGEKEWPANWLAEH